MNGTIIFDLEGTLVDVGGESLTQVFIDEDELRQLLTQYQAGIVTGATRAQLDYVLQNTFLQKYFDAGNTVSVDESSDPKATGIPFQTLLDRGFYTPAVIVGDSEGDGFGARELRIPFVKVHTTQLLAGESFSSYLQQVVKLLS